ncbi:MAG: DNA polymerase III subunit [Desulfitobacteriaceae bacterium]
MNPQSVLLEKAAQEDRLAHLLQFHGGSALERKDAGLRLAQILNCQSSVSSRPCQECTACRKILSGNHPDVVTLEPLKTSIGIEQVLVWQEKVYRKHYEGKYKVFLIDQADRLTIPAANALLKVIEEPPIRTVIILSVQNLEGILPTIRSRAQNIYFPPPGFTAWVKRRVEADLVEAEEAFALSGGTPDLAGEILTKGVNTVRDWIDKFRTAVRERDFLQLFPLFPVERELALLYLQAMTVQMQEELKLGQPRAGALRQLGKAMEKIERQASPRLVLEVLALQLFQQGGTQGD